jgi:hypothetical protein
MPIFGSPDHPYGEYGFQYRGMGGLVTNLIDLWRLDRTLASGELLDSKSLEEMTRPGKAGYALGWRIKKIDSGAIVHEHTGKVRGFLASIQRNPSSDGAYSCSLTVTPQLHSRWYAKVVRTC